MRLAEVAQVLMQKISGKAEVRSEAKRLEKLGYILDNQGRTYVHIRCPKCERLLGGLPNTPSGSGRWRARIRSAVNQHNCL